MEVSILDQIKKYYFLIVLLVARSLHHSTSSPSLFQFQCSSLFVALSPTIPPSSLPLMLEKKNITKVLEDAKRRTKQ
ncbi:hypothetical protein GLYMA_09G225800v4 [Glycine max]|uniref:Uncharacterized protein n=2 Tax=Glycine subgen. Soja TaxID=1462606 RepID=A0A0R0IJE9_SOYBN|nr:hypothetical protein JHK87_025849 [Glycine soja]KAG5007975.1 hypothetical protein JHK85_026517 [Glycine max]KRH39883.1 hypothetical protein GLYMA_09G225800v4 [Glycine max]RZB93374.1 hypothetical protein D0Y65_024971 [Glycine soja]